MIDEKKIYVTQPFLPPLDAFIPYLEQIWQSKILTNGGPYHQQLEQALCSYLNVKYISLFTNGTIALVTALQALNISGEVITTPYSFVATAHALIWNNIKPVFVDIDPKTLNLDPSQVAAKITEHTQAILPVHCYGQPCDTQAIDSIAKTHSLKVIYDAAHAFGVRAMDNSSILNSGDLSVLSFHATKVFNTFEGGAIVCHDLETKQRIDRLKNFGFVDEVTVIAAGINGKMSELNAAFGLLQLDYLGEMLAQRQAINQYYTEILTQVKGIEVVLRYDNWHGNFSYFPILITPDYPLSRDQLYEKLKQHNIFSRRYFYPLISSFPTYSNLVSAKASNLPIATSIADHILCLPIYPGLSLATQLFIVNLIKEN